MPINRFFTMPVLLTTATPLALLYYCIQPNPKPTPTPTSF